MNTKLLPFALVGLALGIGACRARPADPEELAAADQTRSVSTAEVEAAPVADAVSSVAPPDAGIVTSDVRVQLTTVEGSGQLPPQALQRLRRPALQPQNIRIDNRVPSSARVAPRLTPLRPVHTQSTGTLQLNGTTTTPAPAQPPSVPR